MFVYGGYGKVNVLLTESDLEIVKAMLLRGVLKDKLYKNVLNIEKAIRRAIKSNGDIVLVIDKKDNDDAYKRSCEQALANIEFLFKRAARQFQKNRIKII